MWNIATKISKTYTIVVTLLLYPLVLNVNKKLEAWEKRRAQKFV